MRLPDRPRWVGCVTLIMLAGVSTVGAAQPEMFVGRWVAGERDRGVLVTLIIGTQSTLVLPGTGPNGRTEALTLKLRNLETSGRTATFAVDFPLGEGTAEFEFRLDDEGERGTLRALRVDGEAVDDADFPKWALRKSRKAAAPSLFQSELIAYITESSVTRENTRLGIVTMVTPESRGEMVRVRVPIGELTTRFARGVSSARRRRAERKAREEVERDLREFLRRQAVQ